MACDVPISFAAVQIYVPASFLSAFVIVKVWSLTVAFFPGSSSKSLVQDTTGGGYPITWHLGSTTSLPLSAYIGPGEREMSGRAVIQTVKSRLVTHTGLNFSDTLEYAINQEVDRFY